MLQRSFVSLKNKLRTTVKAITIVTKENTLLGTFVGLVDESCEENHWPHLTLKSNACDIKFKVPNVQIINYIKIA